MRNSGTKEGEHLATFLKKSGIVLLYVLDESIINVTSNSMLIQPEYLLVTTKVIMAKTNNLKKTYLCSLIVLWEKLNELFTQE